MRCKIGFQDGFPTAFAVKEPKDMDGLCSFIDLIKGQVALHRHKPDAKAGQKWVTDNGKASEIGKRGFYLYERYSRILIPQAAAVRWRYGYLL